MLLPSARSLPVIGYCFSFQKLWGYNQYLKAHVIHYGVDDSCVGCSLSSPSLFCPLFRPAFISSPSSLSLGVSSGGPRAWSGPCSNVPVWNHLAADFATQLLQFFCFYGFGHGHLPQGTIGHFPVLLAAATTTAATAAAATATTATATAATTATASY